MNAVAEPTKVCSDISHCHETHVFGDGDTEERDIASAFRNYYHLSLHVGTKDREADNAKVADHLAAWMLDPEHSLYVMHDFDTWVVGEVISIDFQQAADGPDYFVTTTYVGLIRKRDGLMERVRLSDNDDGYEPRLLTRTQAAARLVDLMGDWASDIDIPLHSDRSEEKGNELSYPDWYVERSRRDGEVVYTCGHYGCEASA